MSYPSNNRMKFKFQCDILTNRFRRRIRPIFIGVTRGRNGKKTFYTLMKSLLGFCTITPHIRIIFFYYYYFIVIKIKTTGNFVFFGQVYYLKDSFARRSTKINIHFMYLKTIIINRKKLKYFVQKL